MIYKFWFLKRNPIRTQFQQLILLIALCGSLPCLSQNTFTFDEEQSSNLSIDQLLALLDRGESIAGKTLVMNEIRFEFGQANLTEEAKTYLDKVVRLLTAIPSMNLTIAGHTDNVGDPSANLKLSQARALSVYNYLIARGVLVTRLSHEGYGDTKPIADNQSEQGRERNRRVEFGIVQSNQAAENSQMQDVIYLTDGSKIGAYNLKRSADTLYYTRFTDGSQAFALMENIERINFEDGDVYQKPEQQTKLPIKDEDESTITRHEEGTFLYRLRYFDISQGLNLARLTSNSAFRSTRDYFWRIAIGYDFYRREISQTDSTNFMGKATRFLKRTNFYLRAETGLCGQGGYFDDRVGSIYYPEGLSYGISYWENTLLLQKSMWNDHLNLHGGLSLMVKIGETIYGDAIELDNQKLTRRFDLQANFGFFFRFPWWNRDYKLGMRYNIGLIDVSNNRLSTNPFYKELNFNRNLALILKIGI